MIDEDKLNSLSDIKLIDVYAEMFRKGDFSFIVEGEDEDGNKVSHEKQREALEILTSGKYDEFLYGGAAGGCYPKGTEFFNGNKWVKIENYKKGDMVLDFDPMTNESKLTEPISYINQKADQFYTINNRRLNFTTSKHHKHLLINHKTKKLVVKRTDEILNDHNRLSNGNKKSLVTSFIYNPGGISVSDINIRLRVAIMADAHLLPIVNGNKFCINIKKQRKKDRLEWLLKENDIDYKKVEYPKGFSRYYFYFETDEKEFEDYWYESSIEQKKVICDEVLKWDGSIEKRKGNRKDQFRFTTTSKKSLDFIQFAFSSIGYSTSTYTDTRKDRVNECYSLRISNSNGIGITKNTRVRPENTTTIEEVESEDGRMYCFEVDTGFFVVRQNGEIFVSGNSKSWTGCVWLMFMGICYPGIKSFIGRNELKDILDSVYVTFCKVARTYGFTDFKFNAVKNYILFGNTSHINFIEVKYKPSDKDYDDVGSTEYTIGWGEEIAEWHEKAATVLSTRVGRHLNKQDLNGKRRKNPIRGTVLWTCNPTHNWGKREFYDKYVNGTLEPNKAYLQCLITENPFIEKEYVEKLRKVGEKDKAIYERLFKGNWNFIDNPYQLAEQEMIEAIFDNDHVKGGRTYITADIARHGSDKAVIIAWSGWVIKEVITYDYSSIPDIVHSIKYLRNKYRVPKTRAIADADGIGGSVCDYAGIKEFKNGARPIRVGENKPNYRNLQVQCLYELAEKINEGGLYIDADLEPKVKDSIKEELTQIQSVPNKRDDNKLDCKPKSEIKQDLGRSPDYRDAIFMRVFFDLKRPTANLTVKVR